MEILTENRTTGNRSNTPISIRPFRLNRQLPLLTRTHIQQSLVPSFDNLSLTDRKRQRLAALVRFVEHGAIGFQCSAVVDVDAVSGNGLAVAFGGLGYFDVEGFVEGEDGGEESEEGGEEEFHGCFGGLRRNWSGVGVVEEV